MQHCMTYCEVCAESRWPLGRCLLAQAAYSSCATCACTASSSCTQVRAFQAHASGREDLLAAGLARRKLGMAGAHCVLMAQAQLSAPACQLCAAPSLDLCTAFSSNRTVVAVAVSSLPLDADACSAAYAMRGAVCLWGAGWAGRGHRGHHGGPGRPEPVAAGAASSAACHAVGAAGRGKAAHPGTPGAAGPGACPQPAAGQCASATAALIAGP